MGFEKFFLDPQQNPEDATVSGPIFHFVFVAGPNFLTGRTWQDAGK
jgi:hypothetical protein